jgi:hypothetical protein
MPCSLAYRGGKKRWFAVPNALFEVHPDPIDRAMYSKEAGREHRKGGLEGGLSID